MPILFYARGGKDRNRSSQGEEISMATVMSSLSGYDTKYFSSPPGIDPEDNPSPYSAYKYVVIEIGESETNGRFPNPGNYWFPDLTPEDCKRLLGQFSTPIQ